MSVTFQLSKVQPVSPNPIKPITQGESILDLTKIEVEACGTSVAGSLIGAHVDSWNGAQTMNGFLRAIHTAYDQHLPLLLSPDDVWLSVAQAFANHVNLHAGLLRHQFVQHEGQKLIEIQRDGFLKGSPDNDWIGALDEFSDQIAEHIGPEKRDLLVANFALTGPIEKAASIVTMMDAMKAYLDYGCRTCCGFPQVTLLGSRDDWESIQERARGLAQFACQDWIEVLVPVLAEFVAAFTGSADPKFWDSFYKVGHGSGGPYITGAVNVFYPYLLDYHTKQCTRPNRELRNWKSCVGHMCGGPTSDQVPVGLSRAPFKWIYLGQEFPMEFVAGFIGTARDPTTLEVRPAIGWGVADRQEAVQDAKSATAFGYD